jgi:3-oxoacyl-[acyl-carrier protein] reductase
MTQRTPASELTFSAIAIGDIFTIERAYSPEDVAAFAAVSGDWSPLHVDESYARGTEFGRCVVHGMLLASLFSQLVGMRIPGKHALYLGQDLTFRRPVFVGDAVRAFAKVASKSDATRTIVLATEIRTADDRVAVSGTAKVKVRDAAPSEPSLLPRAATTALEAPAAAKVVLVTGASRGIGAEVARLLAGRGFAVAVNYLRSEASAARVVADIARAGGRAVLVRADVRDPDQVKRMVEQVTLSLGPVTAVVNGAIGDFGQIAAEELAWDRFQDQLDVQVRAALQVCQAAYPHMKAAGGGAIVNILSQVSGGPPPARMADYVTAKYALEGLSKALAVDWASDGIRVNMVSPSLVQTDLTQHYPERVFRMEAARTPLRRLATTADVAQAIAYLVDDDASFLTGVNLFLTGGQVMI